MFRHRVARTKQHLAIVAASVTGAFRPDGVEALFDGAGRFIGGQNATARCDHGLRDLVEFSEIHRRLHSCRPGNAGFWPILSRRETNREWLHYFTFKISTPGSALPSIHSRN